MDRERIESGVEEVEEGVRSLLDKTSEVMEELKEEFLEQNGEEAMGRYNILRNVSIRLSEILSMLDSPDDMSDERYRMRNIRTFLLKRGFIKVGERCYVRREEKRMFVKIFFNSEGYHFYYNRNVNYNSGERPRWEDMSGDVFFRDYPSDLLEKENPTEFFGWYDWENNGVSTERRED